jgi:hypothetical protein
MKTTLNITLSILTLVLFTIKNYAQVGIGTNAPNASAKLEINAAHKGLLIPRVTLTGSADATTILSPASSLLVYNTATINDVVPGYYYNNPGASGAPLWIRLNTGAGLTGLTGAQ